MRTNITLIIEGAVSPAPILGIVLIITALTAITLAARAKDDPNLPIHAWCVKDTPQWPSCIPKTTKCPAGWQSALAGMYHCKGEKK